MKSILKKITCIEDGLDSHILSDDNSVLLGENDFFKFFLNKKEYDPG